MFHSVARRHTSGAAKLSEGGGVPVSVSFLAVLAGCGFDDGSVNLFLAVALLRVVRDAVPVQAPAAASVVPSAAVRGFDIGVSDAVRGFDTGVSDNTYTYTYKHHYTYTRTYT